MSLVYTIARNCLGIAEIPGVKEHPMIRWAFDLAGLPQAKDDTEAWCGAFMALMFFLAGHDAPRLPARARSWLSIGHVIDIANAQKGDVVILTRGQGKQPGPDVLNAQGHVGLLDSIQVDTIAILGGNQGNAVTIAHFPKSRLLGIRRPA